MSPTTIHYSSYHLIFFTLVTTLLTCFRLPLATSSSFSLATIAIATLPNTTLVCAFLPVGAGSRYELTCANLKNRTARSNYTYGSSSTSSGSSSHTAIAAGNGFVCSLGPTSGDSTMSMQWCDLTAEPEGAGWCPPSKPVYRGPPVVALSAGVEHACGLVNGRLQCWRWPEVAVPRSVEFSAVAVGGGYVCGLVKGSGEVRCFGGGGGGVVGREPTGRHVMLAAGDRHACALTEAGVVACWGEAAVAAALPPQPCGVSALAVGNGTTCALWSNWTVMCRPVAARPPPAIAREQFVAVEAQGRVVCGVLMANYSLVCWGDEAVEVGGRSNAHTVFDRVLPGPCAPMASCPCGVWSGSAPLCGGIATDAVCFPCGFLPPPTSNSTTSPPPLEKQRPNYLLIALVSAATGLLLPALVVVIVVVVRVRRRRSNTQDSGCIHAEPPPHMERWLSVLLTKGPDTTVEQFPMAALRSATAGFCPSHRVGSGSFGSVYRASLLGGRDVAIKRAEPRHNHPTAPSYSAAAATIHRRGHREAAFLSELALLSRVNHKNLVRLHGFCAEGGERILVYEYMPNGTLHDHLHKKLTLSPPLSSWLARLRLALDAARGIEYMHAYAVPPIIHRDIKSSNILLDASWTAKVADFGLSLLNEAATDTNRNNNDNDEEPCITAGTVGYMDPEYYRLHHLTDKSDVYSFGVVLLELLSGCRVIQRYEGSGTPKNVVEFAVPHIEADHVHCVLDQRLPLPTPGEMEVVAYIGYLAADCVRPAGRDRPTMSEVVSELEWAVAACEEYKADGESALSRSCTDGSAATA